MKRLVFALLLAVIVPFQLTYLYARQENTDGSVAGIKTTPSEAVLNSVYIGQYHFTLFGYTSPKALVTIDGQGIYDQTNADDEGYFKFDNRFSPYSPREACLSAKDQFGRITAPTCLPPFPVKYNVNIGPVLIPPTISLNKDIYYMNDEIILSGQTVPDSDVNLSVFTKNSSLSSSLSSKIFHLTSIIKPVSAFTFPLLAAKSDKGGNFTLSLPSSNPENFRLFAQTGFDRSISAESIKLNFKVYPIWMVIINFFLMFFNLIKPRLLEIIILGEILYLAFAVLHYLSLIHHRRMAIVLRSDMSLTAEKKEYGINVSDSLSVPSDLAPYHRP